MGPDGTVAIFLPAGAMDVVADVQAWLPVGPAFAPLVPGRLLDTRGQATVDGQGLGSGSLGPGRSVDVTVNGRHGIPATGVSAVVLNLTAVAPSADTFLSAYATDAVRPASSVVNVVTGETRPNLAVVEVGTEGKVRIYNRNGTVDVVADVVGWFASGPPVTIAPASLPVGTVGVRYGNAFGTDVLASGGGAFFCDVSVPRGALPTGLSIPLDSDEEASIAIVGTPWVAGRYDFTLRGDCGGTVALRDYTVTVRSGPLEITPTTVTPWVIDRPASRQLEATGGTGPYSWRVLSGSLPAGIVLSATGELSGSPRGPYSLTSPTFVVTDSVGTSVARAFALFVNEVDVGETYPDAVVGQPFVSAAPQSSPGPAPYTWSSGALPAGLALDPATGVISGTPTQAGTTAFVLSVVDADGGRGRLPVTIVVSP